MRFKIGDIVELDKEFDFNKNLNSGTKFDSFLLSAHWFEVTSFDGWCVGLNGGVTQYDADRFKLSKNRIVKQILNDL